MEETRYRSLRPAPAETLLHPHQQAPTQIGQHGKKLARRQLITVACNSCRRKKARCDGVRPVCSRCSTEGDDCCFDSEPGESRAVAQKRKYASMQQRVGVLESVVDMLASRPEEEAFAILQRMRALRATDNMDLDAFASFLRNASVRADMHMAGDGGHVACSANVRRPTQRSALADMLLVPWLTRAHGVKILC